MIGKAGRPLTYLAGFAALIGLSACSMTPGGADIRAPSAEQMRQLLPLANTPLKQCALRADLQVKRQVTLPQHELAQTHSTTVAPALAQANQLTSYLSASASAAAYGNRIAPIRFGYSGYSAGASAYTRWLTQGDPNKAHLYWAHQTAHALKGAADDDSFVRKLGTLALLEHASLSLASGNSSCTYTMLDRVERQRQEDQRSRVGILLGKAFGDDYIPRGYEQVQYLNVMTLAFALEGDERAYNVVQNARSFQQSEFSRYKVDIAQAQREAEADVRRGQSDGVNYRGTVNQVLADERLQQTASISRRVASPYVNPLADYLSAVMAEMDATSGLGQADEHWDLAATSWGYASALAPRNGMAQAARRQAQAAAAGRGPRGDTKLVHVLIAADFAPRKQVLATFLPVGRGRPLPFSIDVMQPMAPSVRGVRVSAGARSVQAESIADMEAIALRHQQDSLLSRMLVAAVKSAAVLAASNQTEKMVGEGTAMGRFLGDLTMALGSQLTLPDTKSWTALPRGYLAARLEVPKDQDSIDLQLQGQGQGVRARYPLLPEDSTLIYVRAVGRHLYGKAQSAPFRKGRLPDVDLVQVDGARQRQAALAGGQGS